MTLDLRPLTLGELFDRAFLLYRRHFWLFVGITAVPGVFALLMMLFQAALQNAMVSAPDPSAAPDPSLSPGELAAVIGLFVGLMTSMLIYWIVYMIALGATTFAVSELYVGRSVTIAEVYSRMRGRIGALVVLLLLTGLRVFGVAFLGIVAIGLGAGLGTVVNPLIGVLLGFAIGVTLFGVCIFMMLRYGVSVPALVVEGLPPGESIRRSIALTRGRLGRVFLLMLCATLVTYAAVILFQGPFLAGGLIVGFETTQGFWLSVAGGMSGTIGATLTAPFLIIGLALIYYDARIREEGFDLELTLAALDGARA